MRNALYARLADVEDSHWWFTARRQLVRDVMQERGYTRMARGLDVGCGTGGNLGLLSEFCEMVVGIDISQTALQLARQKHPKALLVRADAADAARVFRAEGFDFVTLFNVMYHEWMPPSAEVVRAMLDLLRPGGVLLVTEPAFPCLSRGHDKAGMGARRYTLPQMKDVMRGAGFVNIWGTYFNAVSVLPAYVLALIERGVRRGEQADGTVEIAHPPRPVAAGMSFAMAAERWLLRQGLTLPVGLTLLCSGEKRQ